MRGLLHSFYLAGRGVAEALGERNMRIHCCFCFYVVWAGSVCAISAAEWAAVLLCCGAVLSAECFNSALERLCDELHPGRSEGIRRVKDVSAGAVLLTAVCASAVGCVIFFRGGRPQSALGHFAAAPARLLALALSLAVWMWLIFSVKGRKK